MATELVEEGAPLTVSTQIRCLETGQTLKTDDITYGTARTLAGRIGRELERVFNTTNKDGATYITRVA